MLLVCMIWSGRNELELWEAYRVIGHIYCIAMVHGCGSG